MNIEQIKTIRDEIQSDYNEAVEADKWIRRTLVELRQRGERDEFYERHEEYYFGRRIAFGLTLMKLDDLIKSNS